MKQKTTLTAIVFLVTLIAFGQRTELKNNENLWKSKAEAQINGFKQDDNKVWQNHLFQKNKRLSQNSSFKSSQAIKQRLDSIIFRNWDETTSQWIAYAKDEFTYDTSTNNTQSIYYSWDETIGRWDATSKDEYTYDADRHMIQYISCHWDETISEWMTNFKYEYAYNANGNKTQIYEYQWNETTSQWVAAYKNKYTYDTNGNLAQEHGYFWDETNSQWVVSYKHEYSYDANGNMTQEFEYYWDETSSQWVASYKYEFAYDANSNMIQFTGYYWDENANQWVADYKSEYTYDANGNMMQYIEYIWNENASLWNNNYKVEYFCDSLGNRTQTFNYIWDETTSQWAAAYKYETTYNNSYSISDLILPYPFHDNINCNHMLTGNESYKWDTLSGDWKPQMEVLFYYSEQEVSYISDFDVTEFKIYPNPFSTYVSFNFTGYYDKIILELFDIQGRKVISKEIRNHENVSLEALNTGVYFYTLIINGKKLNGKLIKQ